MKASTTPLVRVLACGAVGLAVVALVAADARADGAFPDSQGLLLPADRPNEIVLATNFGIVLTEDAGQTWTYSCELMSNGSAAALYQTSPPPRDRIFAVTDLALIYTDDRACVWNRAQGVLAGKAPLDFFPDPANADRVWAVRTPDATSTVYTIVESLDGGATFGTVRFSALAGDSISGVELARTDPNVAYLTLRSGSTFAPKLAVTKNGGATWDTRDLSAIAGNVNIRIISVDPTIPGKILLRVQASAGDRVALSLDFGSTFLTPTPLSVAGGVLTASARLPSGTLLIGGVDGVRNVIFRSTNGGTSFTELDAPTVRGLGQRNGRLFVAANNDPTADGYALGESTDEGSSWHALLKYEDIRAISSCAKVACQDDCLLKADLGIWSDTVCSANPAPSPVDGGLRDAGAGETSGAGATTGGWHCGTGGGRPERSGTAALLVLALLGARRRRRAR